MTETFAERLRKARRSAYDPERGGYLTQERFAEFISRRSTRAGFPSSGTVSNWECGRSRPNSHDRDDLCAMVGVLLEYKGLVSIAEANALLVCGGYSPLSESEVRALGQAQAHTARNGDLDAPRSDWMETRSIVKTRRIRENAGDAGDVGHAQPPLAEPTLRNSNMSSAATLIAIRHQSMEQIPARAIRAALPAELRACEIIEIVVDQCDLFQHGRLIDPYEAARRQHDLEERVAALLARHPEAVLAYYGIAHIPLLFLAGYTLSNRRAIMLFENDRYARTWDLLQRGGTASALHLSGLPSTVDRGCTDIVVRISISYRVTEDVVAEVIPEPLASLELGLEQPQLDAITSERQLREYTQAFRRMMDQIHHCFPNATGIHLFYAGPPSLAFCCGQLVSKTIHPRLIVYNFFGQDRPRYSWGLDLTGNLDRDDMLLRPVLRAG